VGSYLNASCCVLSELQCIDRKDSAESISFLEVQWYRTCGLLIVSHSDSCNEFLTRSIILLLK